MVDEIVFNYKDFVLNKQSYPDYYTAVSFHNQSALLELKNTVNGRYNDYEAAMNMLKKRTTKHYFQKIYSAQTDVQSYSFKSFPAYKFILPETLADDWA